MRNIMIAGKMGSGKDTLSEKIKEIFLNYKIEYKNYALANYLKQLIKIPYPNFNKKENRKDIQFLGEFLRKDRHRMSIEEVLHFRTNFYNKNYFDKFINEEIKNSTIFTNKYFCDKMFTPEFHDMFYNKKSVIITDCRYYTEYTYFKELDPDLIFIYVDCNSETRKKRIVERDYNLDCTSATHNQIIIDNNYNGEIAKEIDSKIQESFQKEDGIENLKHYADYVFINNGDDGKFNLEQLVNDFIFRM